MRRSSTSTSWKRQREEKTKEKLLLATMTTQREPKKDKIRETEGD